MANTFTANTGVTVFGNMRVLFGTLTMTTGTGGAAASTPLRNIYFALNAKATTAPASLTFTGSTVAALTANAGDIYQVMLVGY